MIKSISIISAACIMMLAAAPLSAQDARQRKPETIVQDVLALMPIQSQADYNREMEPLVQAAPVSIEMLAAMLQPAEKHTNNMVEYAISGAVNFASTNAKYSEAVAKGLQNAIPKAADKTAKQFLEAQLRMLSKKNDVTYTAHIGAPVYAEAYDQLVKLGDQAGDQVVKTLKSKDHALRMQALNYATDHKLANDELAQKVAKKYSSCKEEGKVDIINWLGENGLASQKSLLIKAVKKGGDVAEAAIEALGRIGGDDAAEVLLAQIGTDNDEEAQQALKCFKGDLNGMVSKALAAAKTSDRQEALLKLAGNRHLKSVADQALALCDSKESDVAEAALEAMPSVVSVKNTASVAARLDKAPEAQVKAWQNALRASVASQNADAQHKTLSAEMKKAAKQARFYPVLAATGTDASVAELQSIWEKNKSAEALEALKQSTNYKAAAPLLKAAQAGDEGALAKYVSLVSEKDGDIDKRSERLVGALGIAKSSKSKTLVLNALGNTPTRNAFIAVGKCLDDKAINYQAALAEKGILKQTKEDIEYDIVKANMAKASDIIKAHGSADDGYAVDEIKKMLAEMQPSPIFTLSDEEKKEGYEILFDGTNLDKWTGNKVGYVPINGCIYVTANYGNESNLYTVKEYQDFVFRFEFCFVRPGVNNGVGIRTPMGVDAAYYGMCESQILDHDDPIYAGLHEYQVHGSVYGVIPAKRIKHKPLGEWSYEEIRVVGDHITVTVNGEVIVDGDVRKACQGHNVDPNGSDKNPYTVDHRNHPGMFNKTGHIGFLGHGAGVKFRNVRVLDLTAKKQAKKGKARR